MCVRRTSMENSSVYSSRYTSNPSVTGDHVKDEILEVTKWANQHLTKGGYSESLVTDLASDIADGITLIRLVHAVSGELLPRHFSNPMMRVQKLENLQLCMKFLKEKNVQLTGVHAEGIAAGNIKSILAVCSCLKRRFTGGPSPRTGGGYKAHHRLSFSSLDKDDIPVLSWVEKMVHREVPDYAALYDGKVVCELVNELHQGAISQQTISNVSSPEERLQLAFDTAQKHLFIFANPIVVSQISSGSEDSKLRSYLQQCKQMFERQSHRKGLMTTLSQPRSSSQKSRRSREEAFESLRSTSGGNRATREDNKIASRTYEGLQERKSQENKPLHSSTGHLATKPHPHSSKKPISDIYVSGASSFTDLSTTRNDHADIVMATRSTHNKHSSSENLNSTKRSGFGRHHSMEPLLATSGLGKSWPRSSGYDSDDAGSFSHYHSQGDIPPFSEGGLYKESSIVSSMESVGVPLRSQSARGGVGQRAPSYNRLNNGSEDGSGRVGELGERMGLLATQFLYERHDMFKQIHRALVKERKKRQAAEQRLKELEKLSKQTMQLYNSRFLELAKEVSVLRGELTSVGRGGLESAPTVTMEIKQLKQQVAELSDKCSHMTGHMTAAKELGPSTGQATSKQSLFLKKATTVLLRCREKHLHVVLLNRKLPRNVFVCPHKVPAWSPLKNIRHNPLSRHTSSDASNSTHYPGPYLKGSAISFKKLSNFFGEAPPRLLDMYGFMEELKYTHLLPVFTAHGITLPELRCINEANLEQLGIPLGARVRIISEVKKLEPLDESDIVI